MAKIPTGTINSPDIIVRPEEIDNFFDLFKNRNELHRQEIPILPVTLPDNKQIQIDPETGFAFETWCPYGGKQESYRIITEGVFACVKGSPLYRRGLLLHRYVFLRSRNNPELPKRWQIHHVNGEHGDNSARNLVAVPPWLHLLLDKDLRGELNPRAITVYEHRVLEKALDIILNL